MDIWQILVIFCLGALFSLTLVTAWLCEEDEEISKPQVIYSEEDLILSEFLETRQAINEDFLVAQKKLLENLNHERRKF